MPLPKHNELRIPVMEFLKINGASLSKDMVMPLSQKLKLTEEELQQMYPSGNGPIFKDRISWALTYLHLSGIITKVGRGIYELSLKGHELLQKPKEIDRYIDEKLSERDALKKKGALGKDNDTLIEKSTSLEKLTPQESLYQCIPPTNYTPSNSRFPLNYEKTI